MLADRDQSETDDVLRRTAPRDRPQPGRRGVGRVPQRRPAGRGRPRRRRRRSERSGPMTPDPSVTIGWDVGGVQVKAARVESRAGRPRVIRTAVRALEIWRRRDQLPDMLRESGGRALRRGRRRARPHHDGGALGCVPGQARRRAVRDGRRSARPFHGAPSSPSTATACSCPWPTRAQRPLAFAATNWIASALFAASRIDEGILVDVGSTTTDIVPIREGRLACEGRTDLDRLVAGELVYSGVLRTNPNTLTRTVPVRGRPCRLAAEQFAVMADVYLILGLHRRRGLRLPHARRTGRHAHGVARTTGAPRVRRPRDAE